MLYTSKRWQFLPHSQTLLLLVAQGTACCGSLFYNTLDSSRLWTQYLQFVILMTGVYGSRINSAIIAVILLLLAKGKKTLVDKLQPYLLIFGLFSPLFFICILFFVCPSIKPSIGTTFHRFEFGKPQVIVSLSVLIISFLVIMSSMILLQRSNKKKKLEAATETVTASGLRKNYSDTMLRSVGMSLVVDHNLDEKECCTWKNTRVKNKHDRDCQMLRHTVLLIYIAISMVVGRLIFLNSYLIVFWNKKINLSLSACRFMLSI